MKQEQKLKMIFQFNTEWNCFLLAFITIVSKLAESYILRLPCLTYANFSIAKSGHKGIGSVMDTFNNLSEDECEGKCIKHRLCKAINTRNSTGENCQLIDKSTEDPFDSATVSPMFGWKYKTTDYSARNVGYLCEEKNPCPPGTTCIDTCTCPGYECQVTKIKSSDNCQEAFKDGYNITSVMPIYVPGLNLIDVRCDMITEGGGWIIFQRRIDASVNFYLGWEDYKNGFGDLNGNFWLGLEKIHKLTSTGKATKLRVDLKHFRDPNSLKYAEYSNFKIFGESEGYKIEVSGYSGNANDSMTYLSNYKFTTKDHDQDAYDSGNCAVKYTGAWWYTACHASNLNGLFPTNHQEGPKYMGWMRLYYKHGGVVFSEMKLQYS